MYRWVRAVDEFFRVLSSSPLIKERGVEIHILLFHLLMDFITAGVKICIYLLAFFTYVKLSVFCMQVS